MSADLTTDVTDRLTSGHYGWLTTVAKSGQPVPKLIWFFFDGAAVFVYTEPTAAKVGHVNRHPRVSLNLDSDGNGGGIWWSAAHRRRQRVGHPDGGSTLIERRNGKHELRRRCHVT